MIPILRVRDKVTKEWVEIAAIKGDPGRGILSIERTKGDGSPGTTDEYTITYTDGETTQFGVYNGKDGGTGTPSDLTAENIAAALGYTPANSADLAAKANRSGWAGNKYLGTDAAGNMVTRDAPAGEGGGSGTPGTSPHIGDNGNWWIGATDTGVKAQGPAGNDYTLTETDITNIASHAAAQIDVSGKLDKSGGTMTGKLVAQNNADYADKQVRNVFVIADGESLPTGANGDICHRYSQ